MYLHESARVDEVGPLPRRGWCLDFDALSRQAASSRGLRAPPAAGNERAGSSGGNSDFVALQPRG